MAPVVASPLGAPDPRASVPKKLEAAAAD